MCWQRIYVSNYGIPFIFIDTKDNIESNYITSNEILYEKDYGVPYRMNNISQELLNNLNTIKSVDGYQFKLREVNNEKSWFINGK